MNTRMTSEHRDRPQLAMSARELAERLDISVRHLRRLDSAGAVPKPIRLGRLVRWLASEIEPWLAAGAPDRQRWEAMKEGGNDSRKDESGQ